MKIDYKKGVLDIDGQQNLLFVVGEPIMHIKTDKSNIRNFTTLQCENTLRYKLMGLYRVIGWLFLGKYKRKYSERRRQETAHMFSDCCFIYEGDKNGYRFFDDSTEDIGGR